MEETQMCSSSKKIRRGGLISESDDRLQAEVKHDREIGKAKRKRNVEPVAHFSGSSEDYGDFDVKKIKLEPNTIPEAFTANEGKKKRKSIFDSREDKKAEILTPERIAGKWEKVLEEKNLEIERLKTRLAELEDGDHWRKGPVISAVASEAWRMTPNKVENVNDPHLSFQAFQELERVAVENKVQTLLPDVLKIFLERDIDMDNLKGENWVRHWPLLGNCRLVCKSWKSSVDRLLELQPLHVNSSPFYTWDGVLDVYFPITPKINDSLNRQVESFKTFLQYFVSLQRNNSSYNPLPSRHLVCHVSIPVANGDFDEKSRKFSDVLQAFGHQLWHFTVKIQVSSRRDIVMENRYRVQQFMCEWLRLVPNLKSLAIVSDFCYNTKDNEIKFQVDQLPFPHLKHLEVFKCDYLNNFASNFLENNRHIQKLFIKNHARLSLVCLSRITSSSFPNLSECSLYVRYPTKVDKATLGTLELEKLTLVFGDWDEQKWNINRFIATVTRTNKLEHITLDFVNSDINVKVQVLELPSLRNIFIMLWKYEVIDWYQLLSRATSLETIRVDIYYVSECDCEKLLRTWGNRKREFQDNMKVLQEAAFWHFLPQLRSVGFTVYHPESANYEGQVQILKRHQMPRLRLSVEFKEY